MTYREGNINDLNGIKKLVLKSWGQFQNELTNENWEKLKTSLSNSKTYTGLLENSYCAICENDNLETIGVSFLIAHGNPTEIYDHNWCYIRLVTVDTDYGGQGIGKQLTQKCIQYAIASNERTIALHTSEIMNKARHIYESLGFKILKEIGPRFGKRYWLYTLDI